MNIHEFVEARLGEDETSVRACPSWPWRPDADHLDVLSDGGIVVCEGFALSGNQLRAAVTHVARHDPARVLREIAAGRDILDRHFNTGEGPFAMACIGCPDSTMDGGPTVDHVDECPELQALAWWWSDHPDWDPTWCPHVVGRHRADIDDERAPAGAWTNTCNHCGTGDGWHWDRYRPRPADSIVPAGTDICPRCGDQNYETATRVCITCTPGHPEHDPDLYRRIMEMRGARP